MDIHELFTDGQIKGIALIIAALTLMFLLMYEYGDDPK